MLMLDVFPLFVGHWPECLIAAQALSLFLLNHHESTSHPAGHRGTGLAGTTALPKNAFTRALVK